MIRHWIHFLLLTALCACASRTPAPQASDMLTESLNHPSKFGWQESPSRYLVYKHFLIHFITNAGEHNKNLTPVFYIHGLGGSMEGYSELIKINHPSDSSRPYYALDLPPFGRSALQKPELTMHDYRDILQKFIAQTGAAKVDLVCHSLGGQVCIEYALSNPSQIRLLTLISPAGVYDKSAFVNWSTNHFVGISVGSVDDPNAHTLGDMTWYDQSFNRRMITNNPMLLIAVDSFTENFHGRLGELKTKTLIIWGREDKIFSYENGLFLKENVENSTLYLLDGAGHSPMTTHAALISKLIQKYW